MSACCIAFCFITSLLSHSLICIPLNSSYTTFPPYLLFFVFFLYLLSVILWIILLHVVRLLCLFCHCVWTLLASFYYFCCNVSKSMQHCLKHTLWMCVSYDIWFIICYYVQTNSIIKRSCMMVTNCKWLVRCFSVRVLPVLLWCSKKHNLVCNVYKPTIRKVRNINGTKLSATSWFKIQENVLAVDLMINALQSIWNFDWNSLQPFEHQCALPFDLFFILFFFSVSCLPQSFDIRMPSFFSHYRIPALWWVNDANHGWRNLFQSGGHKCTSKKL